jgi:transposase-like protein
MKPYGNKWNIGGEGTGMSWFYEGGWTCPECGREYEESQRDSAINHKYNAHNLDTDSYIERYRRIRTEIPEKYHGAYEEITGEGKSPTVFQAAVCYIESGVSQNKASEIFGPTPVAIRQMVRRLIREGVVSLEYVQENSPRSGTNGTFNGVDGECAGQEVKNGI